MTESPKDFVEDALLLALGALITTEITAEELLRRVMDIIITTLDAERGTLFLLDPTHQELVSVAAHLPELDELRVPIDRGVAGYVARTGQVVNIPFCDGDARFWSDIDNQTGFETKTMLAAPIQTITGTTIGVMQILNKRAGIFGESDQRHLLRFTSQTARLLENTTLTKGASDRATVDKEGINQIIGRGPAMRSVIQSVRRVAPLDATVLLRGESGTGKGLFARALHQNSPRHSRPFIHVDCTTLPESLIESELFGHERGAFTGAHATKPGKVSTAEGGTLFLDEIGDLPISLQGKLLTLLQDRTFTPLGALRPHKADIRIVTATNRPLEELIKRGAFREDLYYRLRVVEIELPPLRQRSRDDLQELIYNFITRAARKHGRLVPTLRDDARTLLLSHSWPGNVRELENCLESAVIFADQEITPSTLSLPYRDATRKIRQLLSSDDIPEPAAPSPTSPFTDEPSLKELEERYITYLLDKHSGNKTVCAEILGIGRNTLWRKLQ